MQNKVKFSDVPFEMQGDVISFLNDFVREQAADGDLLDEEYGEGFTEALKAAIKYLKRAQK